MKRKCHRGRSVAGVILALAMLLASGCVGQNDSSSPEQLSSTGQEGSSSRLPEDKPAWNEVSSHDPLSAQLSTALPQVKTPFSGAKTQLEYERLPSQRTKQAYEQMLQAVGKITLNRNDEGEYRIERIFLEDIALTESELKLVLSALRSDNPQIFWLTNRFGYYNSPKGTSVELYSYYSAKECTQRSQKLSQAVRKMVAVLHEGQSEFDRELALHDALLRSVVYDRDAVNSTDKPEPFTAYGALVEGKAVCQGYALAIKLLLSYAGLESTIVSGTSQDIAHAWNAVRLGDDWYYLDATWNDIESNVRYDYFNITSELLQLDHTIDPVYPGKGGEEQYNLWVPDCTATAENFFTRKAVYLDGFDEENDRRLLAKLQTMLASGNMTLSICFDSSMNYEESVAMLISEQPYKLVYLMQRANQMYGSVNSFAMENIQYSKVKSQNAVIIWLKTEITAGQ